MTAEIAILNKNGIALAADSAVSIGSPQDTRKIYNSANKLFMLSKYHPVAFMVYGGGSFVGVPWEILIKEYRAQLEDRSFSTLLEYAEDFWSFTTNNRGIFSVQEEQKHVLEKIRTRLLSIQNECIESVRNKLETCEDNITDEDFVSTFIATLEEILEAQRAHLESLENLDNFNDEDKRNFIVEYSEHADGQLLGIFENLHQSIREDLKDRIYEVLALSLIKRDFDQSSGIVFAGYGCDEIYPRVAAYQVGIMYNGKPRSMFLPGSSTTQAEEFTPSIIPFAQDEVVRTFLTGMDPSFNNIFNMLQNGLSSVITERLPEDIFGDNAPTDAIKSAIKEHIDNFMQDLNTSLDNIKRTTVLDPILEMLEYLPKDELAEMAETLVNLTAFKRKMSNSLESVGGPIDVAILSKGDGFIWFKRKHYFEPKFNQHYFANYYNGTK
ncbi:hypothetical protein KOI40_06165 [Aestuariicella sp. G3-2]|uniref:hypothetical protein n=1 Tax=Pseudomaricurvus albidus TaxID=2842452 RepID=UPI001C0E27BC|nr:hypothetical protein [Aestuariicella albida]MBU3069399.1 hypothetical protein [Aestuariicella albida]